MHLFSENIIVTIGFNLLDVFQLSHKLVELQILLTATLAEELIILILYRRRGYSR